MVLNKRQISALSARKLRSIASGKFKGITSSQNEMKYAKEELSDRGLDAKKKKSGPYMDWTVF